MTQKKLNWESNGRSGQGRYYKTWRKQKFRSKNYPKDTRENYREAWQAFLDWQQARIVKEAEEKRAAKPDAIKRQILADQFDFISAGYRQIGDSNLAIEFDQVRDSVEEASEEDIAGLMTDVVNHPPHVKTVADIGRQVRTKTPTEKTLSYWRDRWFALRETDTKTPKAHSNLCRDVNRLVSFFGESSAVDVITTQSYEDFCLSIKKLELAGSTERDIFGRVKAFVEYLSQHDQIELPKNLRAFKGIVDPRELEHFSLDEMRYILDETEGHLKCFVHLMANCGMYPSDIAALMPSEFDGDHITRKRSKRKAGERLPTVSWQLWPETIQLIQQYRTDKTGLLFTMPKTDRPWYLSEMKEDNKTKEYNPIRKAFERFRAKHSIRFPLSRLRKSAAHYLPAEKDQLSAQIKFLGEKPSGVALKHYVDVEQHLFDRYILGLRERIFSEQNQ